LDWLFDELMGANSKGSMLPDPMELPRVIDPRGNLTALEGGTHVPFSIARVYYLYDAPGGATRGGHAHRSCIEFIIAAMGSFDLVLDNGWDRKRIHLNRSYFGVLVPTLVWRELDNFSSGSVCLVLASEHFAEDDYIRDHSEFLAHVGAPNSKQV
jgi:hypothetical protein